MEERKNGEKCNYFIIRYFKLKKSIANLVFISVMMNIANLTVSRISYEMSLEYMPIGDCLDYVN